MTTNEQATAALSSWAVERVNALPIEAQERFLSFLERGEAEVNIEMRLLPTFRLVMFLDFAGPPPRRVEISRFEAPTKKPRLWRRRHGR
ncbi:MAG: hypothetical protein ACHQ01_01665 [Candidatus Limnocylindrales bacterium]